MFTFVITVWYNLGSLDIYDTENTILSLSPVYIEEELGIVIGKNASSNLFEHQHLHLSSVSGIIILVPWAFATL